MNHETSGYPDLPEHLELVVPDMSGIPRGKTIRSASFDPGNLPHIPAAIFFQTLTGSYVDAMEDYNPTDADVLLEPDWNTLRAWRDAGTAQVCCRPLEKDGRPLAYDPRNVLIAVLDAYRDQGLAPVIAPEVEFYLLDPGTDAVEPFRPGRGLHGRQEHGGEAFSIDSLSKYDGFLADVEQACRNTGISLQGLVHEMGPAQVELNIAHGPALDRTDQLFTVKRIVRTCAQDHGLCATFMARPLEGRAGSGLHLHVSAYAGEDNAFALSDGKAGPALRHFIGGLQRYLPEAFALIAPNVNSYKRFVRDLSAPINLAWGYDNRTTGFRVPYDKDENGRVENRVAGADANPYLLVAATLACGLLGMREALDPGEPAAGDAYELAADLPPDLGAALQRLGASSALEGILGRPFMDVFSAVKAHELAHFHGEISPWERRYLGAEL